MKSSILRATDKIADRLFQLSAARHLSIQHRIAETITQQIADRCIADNAAVFDDAWQLRQSLIKHISTDGALLEFGVYTGGTINFFSERIPNGHFDGFDTFEGLPSGKGVWKKYFEDKKFDIGGKLPKVNANVTLHKGLIENTLPEFIATTLKDRHVSFVHVDVDIYEATVAIFSLLGSRIVPGTVILFDEYCNYDGFYNEEYRAFQEFIGTSKVRYKVLAVGSAKRKFGSLGKMAVRIE